MLGNFKYVGVYLAVVLHETTRKIHRRYVCYGSSRGEYAPGIVGSGVWGCNFSEGGSVCDGGDYAPTLEAARREAEAHAKTHRGVRAFYCKG
jgi:hypothetical protein